MRAARTVLINAGPWLPVPPADQGGVENMLAELIVRLRRQGVTVVLATVGESAIEADEKIAVFAEGQYRRVSNRPYNSVSGIPHAHMIRVADRLARGDIDLVHDHLEVVGPSTYRLLGTRCPPVLHTLHWPLGRQRDFYRMFDGAGRIFFNVLSPSHLAQADANLRRQVVGAVPNGVDPAAFPFQPQKEDYFLVLGRITEDKGQDIAARLCQENNRNLVLAGTVASVATPAQFEAAVADERGEVRSRPAARFYLDRVRPYVDGERVRWVGAIGGATKLETLARARALLVPVRWDEPFGIVVIEALACGTPVIATRRGNLPALVEHGVNGFLADGEDDLAGYLDRVSEIDPAACRQTVERRFSADGMAARYVELYEQVIARAGARG